MWPTALVVIPVSICQRRNSKDSCLVSCQSTGMIMCVLFSKVMYLHNLNGPKSSRNHVAGQIKSRKSDEKINRFILQLYQPSQDLSHLSIYLRAYNCSAIYLTNLSSDAHYTLQTLVHKEVKGLLQPKFHHLNSHKRKCLSIALHT